MLQKHELGVRLVFVVFFVTSLMTSGLWAAGYLEIEYQKVVNRHTAIKSENTAMDIPWDLEAFENQTDFSQFPIRQVTATGYTAGYESTGKTAGHPQYGITFSGLEVRRDLFSTIAADINVFPLGTILYIPGYGYGVVADIGGAIKGDSIDLYYETVDDVYQLWGKQKVDVYVIKEGEGTINDALLDELNNLEHPLALPVYKAE